MHLVPKYGMRLFELELPPTYLCSNVEILIGSTTEKAHACDLGASCEGALERRRPEDALPRDTSLQLHTDPNHDAEYVYLVRPVGQVDRFHTSWLKKLAQTNMHNEGEMDGYATGFWSGKPIPEDRNAPWVYRAMKARVLKRAGGSALWIDRHD